MTSKAFGLAQLGNAYSDGALGSRNRIINGAMVIDQRNAGAAVTTAASPYTVDRFLSFQSAGQFTYQRITDAPTGFANSLRITRSTASAGSVLLVEQLIEGFNCADLMFGTASAQTVTLSFWVKSSITGTFSGHIANKPTTRSYVFTYSINSANTWEFKTVSLPGDTSGVWATDSSAGLKALFNLGTGGGTTTANSWQAGDFIRTSGSVGIGDTLDATWQITGVQLEAGDTATPFEHRSFGQELALCQRYYQELEQSPRLTPAAGPASQPSLTYSLATTMRAAPTATLSVSANFGNTPSAWTPTTTSIGVLVDVAGTLDCVLIFKLSAEL